MTGSQIELQQVTKSSKFQPLAHIFLTMGICQSCLYGELPDIEEENEQAGLLGDSQTTYATMKDNDVKDRKKHEETLNNIVNFTGRNLIDVTSVGIEDFTINGKSTSEYKQALDIILDQEPTDELPTKFGKNLSLKLAKSQIDWLNKLAHSAEEAIDKEPRIVASGELVQTFG